MQLDDAYLGGERSGGKAGRGSEKKVPFVAAVSVDDQGYPQYVKLAPVSGFTLEAVGQWAQAALMPGMSGAFHAFKYPKYASSYLAAFAYRFNRRFDLRGLVARLIIDVSRGKPRAQRVVRGNAEDRC